MVTIMRPNTFACETHGCVRLTTDNVQDPLPCARFVPSQAIRHDTSFPGLIWSFNKNRRCDETESYSYSPSRSLRGILHITDHGCKMAALSNLILSDIRESRYRVVWVVLICLIHGMIRKWTTHVCEDIPRDCWHGIEPEKALAAGLRCGGRSSDISSVGFVTW